MKLCTLAPLGLLLLAATASADTVVYDLDARNAKEIADAIASVLAAQCAAGPTSNPGVNQQMCQSKLLPTGQLLVEAPATSQAQLAAVLKTIAARDASPTPRVTLQYWVIYGEPGKPDSSDAALKPLGSVLQQLERAHGDLGFSVLESATLTTQSGTSSKTSGGSIEISQQVRANGDSLSAALELEFAARPLTQGRDPVRQEIRMTVTIKRGEYLVLGERSAGDPDRSGTLFYVVHWPQAQ